MKGVCPTICMRKVIWSAKFPLRGKHHTTVIEKAILYFVSIHKSSKIGVPQRLLAKEVEPEMIRLWLASKDYSHQVGQSISQVFI